MELRVLYYFLTVAEEGNITRAAELLHMTQPTLSRQLKELEEELGVTLFYRGKRQITLTDAGILLQQRAKEITTLVRKTERDLENQSECVNGVVAIGCVETKISFLLPELLKTFSECYPAVQYELYSADGDDIREKLDRGRLDVGILVEPVEMAKYESFRLPCQDRWGVLLRTDDPLAKQGELQADQLGESPLLLPRRELVKNEIESWLGVDWTGFPIILTHNLLGNAALLVKHGMGRAITLEGAAELRKDPELCFLPLVPPHTSGHVVAWRRGQMLPSAASKFIEFIKCFVSMIENKR